jgi:ADP-heptose:LPS heptosyltransferase
VKEKIDSALSAIDFKDILVWSSMGIGNSVNFMPMLRNLRINFPEAKITLLSSSNKGNYELMEGSNLYDNFIYFDKHSRLQKYLACIKVLFNNYDLFIVKWHKNPLIATFIKFAWRSKTLGHVSGGGWTSPYDHLIDFKVPMEDGIHDVHQYLNLLKPLGIEHPIAEQNININSRAIKNVDNVLKTLGITTKRLLIGLHFDAGLAQPYKNLDFTIWTNVLKNLEVEYPHALFFLLGGAESSIGARVLKDLDKPLVFFDFTRKFSLHETTSFIARLDILIAVDSSLKTIADAVGTPSVIASGATNYIRSQPIQTINQVVRVDIECSPCDIFGPTKWNVCSHRSCVKNFRASWMVDAVIAVIEQSKSRKIEVINR